jgi:hypothetical protein
MIGPLQPRHFGKFFVRNCTQPESAYVYRVIRFGACGPVRDALIRKGMVYSPAHGDIGFTSAGVCVSIEKIVIIYLKAITRVDR